ncbi:MAG TPA: ribonuclease D [Candidatus Kryptonia bacterium]|nr:ribonuclease D [Candidatus Kryptonia bacterium]
MSIRTMEQARPPHVRDSSFLYVQDVAGLRRVVSQLGDSERFGLDTEFVGERTYTPQLELIQVATEHLCAVLDCRAIGQLDPFFPLLTDPRIEKVLHAGQQDLELFFAFTQQITAPTFDTQVAAAMVGYGAQPGYAPLVERLLGVAVEKTETLTDWTRRPLTQAQLAYAADDVRYLLAVHDQLRQRLKHLDRASWAQEEFRRLEQAAAAGRADPRAAYLRVRGRGALRAKGLAILRELAAWREEEARARNKPRGSVLKDELLVELARRAPTTPAALRSLRALHSRELERSTHPLLAAVERALDLPKSEWPEPPKHSTASAPTGLVELLQAVLRNRAEHAHIAPNLLATTADLEQLASQHRNADGAELPILQGWRRKLAGEQLLDVLEGRASVRIDPATHRLRIETQRP